MFSLPLLYIDPGTGTAVLYALAAMGTVIAFRFRQFKAWLVQRFRGPTE